MAIKEYFKLKANGKKQRLYLVTAEGVNKYTGKRRSKKRRGVTSRPRAEQIYKEIWYQCRNEKPDELRVENLGQLIEKYLTDAEEQLRNAKNSEGLSLNTFKKKKSLSRHFQKWHHLHLDLITPKFVHRELDTWEHGGIVSRSLTKYILNEVKCIFVFALESGIIKYNPFERCKHRKLSKKKPQALNHSETNFFLKEAFKRNHPYYFIWLLALTLGLRRSELAGLKWTDVDFERRLLHVQRQLLPTEGLVEKTKSSRDRMVAIPEHVIPALQKFKLQAKTDFVVEVDCGNWKRNSQSQITRKFCREIGIKEVTFHQLRATYITLAITDGIPAGIVQTNVGHSSLSTTDGYFRSSGIELEGKTDKLNINVPGG